MGVAVSVSTWTDFRSSFSRSLCADAEPVLLVHDQEPEILEGDVLLEEPVRADTTSTVPAASPARTAFCSFGRPEARQHLDPHRVALEALAERVRVLLGEDRRGHEDRHLLPVQARP